MKKRVATDRGEQNIIDHVRDFGWSVIQIFDPDGKLPNFSYSIGMFETLQTPEIIIYGLDNETAKMVINNIGQEVKKGMGLKLFEQNTSFFQEPCICAFIEVDKSNYNEHFGFASWFYGGWDFPVYQSVWSDEKGKLPWEKGFNTAHSRSQPLLGQAPHPVIG